jgi:hypothetical protein
MFRNRWGALLFVGLTLAGVAQLVGTGKGDGAIERARSQIAAQRARAGPIVTRSAPTGAAEVKVEFVPDEELIDLALGEDPTPIDQRAEERMPGQPADGDPPAGAAGPDDGAVETVVSLADGLAQEPQ